MRDPRGLFIGSLATLVMACSSGNGSVTAPDVVKSDGSLAGQADTRPGDAAPSGNDAGVLFKDAGAEATPDAVIRDDLSRADSASKDGTSDLANSAPADASAASREAGADLSNRADATARDLGKSDAAAADTFVPTDTLVPADALPVQETGGGAIPPTCASEPLRTTGTVHYICDCQSGASSNCVAGNDSNAGTTSAAPLRSFAKAADTFAKMPAGDTVALCRGGKWTGAAAGFANINCKKDNTCDLRDYAPPWGDGSEALPSIWTDGGSTGATTVTFSHISQHQEGFRVFNLDLHGTTTDTALFFWNETTDVDLCNLSMDGFYISVNMSGGDKPEFGIPSNIVLRRSRITNNTNIGYIAVCDNCAVEDSYFDNNGVRNATTHSVYFASTVWTVNGQNVVHETNGMRLSRNEFHHSTIQCQGAPVVVHGRHKNVILENNLMDAANPTDGCWGLGVGCGGYPYGCWFRNSIIRGNTINGLGNTGTENNNCTGCLIENNVVIMTRSGNGITLGGETPRASGDASYSRSDGQLDDPVSNTVVRNNTIQFTTAAASGKGIAVSSGTGHTVENNAIRFTASQAGSTDNLCYGLCGSSASVLTSVDYNVCEIPSGAHWTNTPDAGAVSLDAWQRLTGFDKHSKMVDPGFSNPPTDFCPSTSSPLVNAGDPANSPAVDMNGKQRDSQPDVGAIER